MRLPCAPPELASGAMREIVFPNRGALTLPAMETLPGLLAGIAAVLRDEVICGQRRGTLLTEAGLVWIERSLEHFEFVRRQVGIF